jgi:hypothetical protein
VRSSEPMPGEPWPHDMMLTIEDRPNALLELLWIREAYGLAPRGHDLPPLLREAPAAVADAAFGADARAAWEKAWPAAWHDTLAHAGTDRDPRIFDQLQATPVGSAERAALLRRLTGPSWADAFGSDAIDGSSYRAWSENGAAAHMAALSTRLEDSPERRDLAALIPAWRAGLTIIITIPCAGEFTHRVGRNALLVTDSTRAESAAYRRALESFGPPG